MKKIYFLIGVVFSSVGFSMLPSDILSIFDGMPDSNEHLILKFNYYMFILMPLIFCGIGISCLALLVRSAINSIKLKKEGHDALVKFVSCASNLTVNGEKRYYIEIAYLDTGTGKVQLAKTETLYRPYETEFFKKLGTFKARCYKNIAMILEDREKAKEMLFQ